MGQREDVQASLCHEQHPDVFARRKVATEVGQTAAHGAALVAEGRMFHAEVGKAASAVVLASDLRAPAAIELGFGPHLPRPHLRVSENRQGWRSRLAHVEAMLREAVEERHTDFGADPALVPADDRWSVPGPIVARALAEVRAMIDGEGE